MRVTENDVCRAYVPLVMSVSTCVSNIERDDSISAAFLGLIKAIRTWTPGLCEFEEYARSRMLQEITETKRELNRQKRAESRLSLDALVNPEIGDMTYLDLLTSTTDTYYFDYEEAM